eukprot:GDKJ01017728.1.p1 GENE.GDKJ01017728.1~~GDKJ01017728.1.p1  ORF type:complete len:271 (-),score=38.57 GDKJ01017728.1:605-1417(-)
MASPALDAFNSRKFTESVNFYDNGKSVGTACEKTLASRISGVNYNILTNRKADPYFSGLRSDSQGDAFRKPFWQTKKTVDIPFKDSRQMKDVLLSPYEVIFDGSQLRKGEKFRPIISTSSSFRSTTASSSSSNAKHKTYDTMRLHVTCPSSFTNHVRHGPYPNAIDSGLPYSDFEEKRINWSERRGAERLQAITTLSQGMQSKARSSFSSYANRRLDNADFTVLRTNDHYGGHCKVTREDPYYVKKNDINLKGNACRSSVGYDMITNLRE